MYEFSDVVLTQMQFTDTFETKKRPGLVLFEEYDNVVIAGITSNTEMQGISITKEDGAVKKSVIKLNYIFTISTHMIAKKLFKINGDKKEKVRDYLIKKLIS